jgi:predicted DCC family thiol-disulfide oxidoreductase YuxK
MDLIFDGYCGVCTRLIRWVRAQDRHDRITAWPSQLPGVRERFGLSREQADREVWAFDGAGNVWSGAEAIFRTLEVLGWTTVAAWSRRPPFKQLAGPCYFWVARHRHWFARWGMPPECADPARGCLPE